MTFLDEFSKEEIITFVNDSKNYRDVLLKMGRSANSGSNRLILTQYIKDNEINTSHFEAQKHTDEDIFIKNSPVGQSVLKRRYQKGKYSEYKCAICGQEPIWRGQPLTLILDHINGDSSDNELSNLRWICPNCDRQLPTYGTKTEEKFKCSECGKIIAKNKSGLCADCYAQKNYVGHVQDECPVCGKKKKFRAKLCKQCMLNSMKQTTLNKRDAAGATKEKLKTLLRVKSMKQIADEFGVAFKTAKKWCQSYDLPVYQTEIQKYTDEEWDAL